MHRTGAVAVVDYLLLMDDLGAAAGASRRWALDSGTQTHSAKSKDSSTSSPLEQVPHPVHNTARLPIRLFGCVIREGLGVRCMMVSPPPRRRP